MFIGIALAGLIVDNARSGPAWRILILALLPMLCGVGTAVYLWLRAYRLEREQRRDSRHCQNCGYNLTGNVSGICPECGEIVTPKRLIGRLGRVVSELGRDSGEIEIDEELWEARPAGAVSGIDEGMLVLVRAFHGRVLLVSPHKSGPKIK